MAFARRSQQLRAVVAAVLISIIGGPTPASAANFGAWYANGAYHASYQDLLTDYEAAVDWIRTNLYGPTDLTTPQQTDHNTADVHHFDSDYGDTGWYGVYNCQVGSYPTCTHGHIKYNLWAGLGLTTTKRRAIACQEFGHSVGLQHYNVYPNSCMIQYLNPSFPNELSFHDIAHINAQY